MPACRKVLSAPVAALALVTLILSAFACYCYAQSLPERFGERAIDRKEAPEDVPPIWTLDFRFKDPRVVTVNVPGRGLRHVWYLWYQVSNDTGEPRLFVPEFVWVCHDTMTSHMDLVIPKAQTKIQSVEDPTNLLDIKNSVSITQAPIPFIKQFDNKGQRIAFPKLITGVAMWDDIPAKCFNYSIYVYGLSDGWRMIDGPDGRPIVRRKALRLQFKRLGDEFKFASEQVRFVRYEWVYGTQELPLQKPHQGP